MINKKQFIAALLLSMGLLMGCNVSAKNPKQSDKSNKDNGTQL